MKYIINSIISKIINKIPSSDGEMMIKIDSFDCIEIYESIAKKLTYYCKSNGLTINVKLAKNKWDYFMNESNNNPGSISTTIMNSMVSNEWISEAESITYYRNLHDSNLLVLLGTEDEEDKGGLANFYCITPSTLINDIGKNFHLLLGDNNGFSENEFKIVDKLFDDLFEFVPIDILQLSNMIDDWMDRGLITTISDFIECFYKNLPLWGLPMKVEDIPTVSDLNKASKKNLFREEYNFISRNMFSKQSEYKKRKNQLEKYNVEEKKYSSSWDGWTSTNFGSFDVFQKNLLAFIRGENVEDIKIKFLDFDFSILEDIFGFKITGPKPPKNTIASFYGEPLTAFTKVVMQLIAEAKNEDITDYETIVFSFLEAEVVSLDSDTMESGDSEHLYNSWKSICQVTNGVFEYLNMRHFAVSESTNISIAISPSDIFSPSKTSQFIFDGKVKAASANKTLTKIFFEAELKNQDDQVIAETKMPFVWIIDPNSSWLHNFSDVLVGVNELMPSNSFIPLSTSSKITQQIFSKSKEEFFDILDETQLDHKYNVVDFIDKTFGKENDVSLRFTELGINFSKFICEVRDKGFYYTLFNNPNIITDFVHKYTDLGEYIKTKNWPSNEKIVFDAYIYSFVICRNTDVLEKNKDTDCCIVPPWHPAAIEKIVNQKVFFLDGCDEWLNQKISENSISKKEILLALNDLEQLCMIQSVLDIFPSFSMVNYGSMSSFGNYCIYGRNDLENTTKLKDLIHKEAIFDDEFTNKEISTMNDNAKMLYGILLDYKKAFPYCYKNLNLVFVDPSELQPIVASIYRFIDLCKKENIDRTINIQLKILVKPENKGGRNYLSYWIDEFFSQDSNVNIRAYINEWNTKDDLNKLLNANNDIVFVMDLLKVDSLTFDKDFNDGEHKVSECLFPIVYKPKPISSTSVVKRSIELTQPQFKASLAHTQIVRKKVLDSSSSDDYVAVKEVCLNDEGQEIVKFLHDKAYWVVCIDRGMDGALLKNNSNPLNGYSIIGFSTGKGAYGQFNLTITARKTVIDIIGKRLKNRLYRVFHWDDARLEKATNICMKEACDLDGISLLSAINPDDYNINEFMAYVLTSLREKKVGTKSSLKILIHLDSYKHWFSGEIEEDISATKSRPDFLMLEVVDSASETLKLKGTIIECKIAKVANASEHKDKAVGQVNHGIERLSQIFNPNSNSIKRRFWYAQLYRALAFAQVTFADNTLEFQQLSNKLRNILDGNFEIMWDGIVLGYWVDLNDAAEVEENVPGSSIKIYNIPQLSIQSYLLDEDSVVYAPIADEVDTPDNNSDDEDEQQDLIIAEDLVDDESNTIPVIDEPIEDNNEEVDDSSTEKTEPVEEKNSEIKTEECDNFDKLEDVRVLIGKDKAKNKVFWEFGNKNLANRHMLITGTSGQGKTYSIQTMLYEVSKGNVSSVIFDYTEGFMPNQLEQKFNEKMEGKITQHIVYYSGVPINPFSKHEISIGGMIFPEKDADVAGRIASIFTHVYKFGEQQYSAIYTAAKNGLNKYKNNMNMEYFKLELEALKSSNPTAKSVISKMTPFLDSVSFVEDKDFNWDTILYKGSQLNIFQLTQLSREMQVIITELMLWDMWYFTQKVGNKNKPFVVVLDEAQNLSHKSDSPSAKILTEGRKFGWSAWFATQSLKVLDDDEIVRLLQASVKLYFKPTDEEISKIAKQLDPSNSSNWISSVKNLKKGQCIVVGDRIKPDGTFGPMAPAITSVSSFEEREND